MKVGPEMVASGELNSGKVVGGQMVGKRFIKKFQRTVKG